VTVVRVEEGMHDLLLSAPAVREQVLVEMARFVRGYVVEEGAARPARS
jgi:alpha-beta hydrolase superfamily lysophospholipase